MPARSKQHWSVVTICTRGTPWLFMRLHSASRIGARSSIVSPCKNHLPKVFFDLGSAQVND